MIAAGALPIVLLVGASILEYQADIERLDRTLGAESLGTARSAADYLDFLLERTRSALNRVAIAANEGRLTNRILEVERAELPYLAGLFVTDDRGIVRFGRATEIGKDLSATVPFNELRNGLPVTYVNAVRSKFAPEDVIAIAMRRTAVPTFQGVVGSRIRVSDLNRLLAPYSPGNLHDITCVLDRSGKVLAVAGATHIEPGMDMSAHPLLARSYVESRGWLTYVSPNIHAPRVGAYVRMPGVGWTVVSARDQGSHLKDRRAQLIEQVLTTVLTALIVTFLAFVISRRLSRPLEDLAEAIHGVREQDLDVHPVPQLHVANVASDIREVTELIGTYNSLVEALNRRFTEVAAFEKLQALNEALRARSEKIQTQAEELQAQNEEIQSQAEELQIQNDEIVKQNGLIQHHADRLALQNRELERLTADALRSNEHKSKFLANMSHELRTPLNSIIGYSDLILASALSKLDAVTRSNLEVVLRNGRHLLGLINEVLDLARIEAGKTTLYASEFEPDLVLAGLISSTEPLALEKGLVLRSDLSPEVGTVQADETRVRQIVLNLLSNAIKFTRQGEVHVSLRPSGPDRWLVRVSDTGIGIAPDQQEAVFEEFRQVNSSDSRDTQGAGLGLAIARKLARLLGGDLTVESSLGQGSGFTLDLPRRAPVSELAEAEV